MRQYHHITQGGGEVVVKVSRDIFTIFLYFNLIYERKNFTVYLVYFYKSKCQVTRGGGFAPVSQNDTWGRGFF
jgi:hypothetical protein